MRRTADSSHRWEAKTTATAIDSWNCTTEVLPGRQAAPSVGLDQRATPAHYAARRRSPRHLPENGAQARPPSPPRPRARHGQPRPRVAMISACTGRVFDRRRNPGSMAVAGPGAPIVNTKGDFVRGLGHRWPHSRSPPYADPLSRHKTRVFRTTTEPDVASLSRPWPADVT